MRVAAICLLGFLAGCAGNGYQQFYNPYFDAMTMPDVEVLGPEEEPSLFESDDLERDTRVLLAKRYIAIGVASFNGRLESSRNIIEQAKEVGATIVLTSSEYTDTRTGTYTTYQPTTSTTYHSGSVYGSGSSASYSGTSTTYGSVAVPRTYNVSRYDQDAIFFVKTNQKYRFGVFVQGLTVEQRKEIGRNTGALIDVVIEDSPAFDANILPGDVLIAIDDVEVKNYEDAEKLFMSVPPEATDAVLTILRNGGTRDIRLALD